MSEAEAIKILRSFLTKSKIPDPKVIWDIGSGDGREAQILSEAFPGSQILAIEPNPETFPLVEKISAKNQNIYPKNIAVSNFTEIVDFYKINTIETITSWADGNPGASSLLKSSGKYPFEEYVQDLIQVQSLRAAEMIQQQPEIQPQLLWIDVQGTEDQVLKSFDSYINQVTSIVVELSLQEMYSEQALAGQVIDVLKNQFYFVKVLNTGAWQFDALFINKLAPNKFRNWIFDKFFSFSIKTKRKLGIARRFPRVSQFMNSRLIMISSFIVEKMIHVIRRSKGNFPNFFIDWLLTMTKSNSKTLANYSRMLAEISMSSNPLNAGENPPKISVLIPVVSKDFATINLIIRRIIENSLNPVSSVTVVYAGDEPQIDRSLNVRVQVLHESSLIPWDIEEAVQRYPKNRQGWVRQQVIKFLVAGNLDAESTLVCDSDTFLCEKRLWLNESGAQQLQISHEYSIDYEQHFLDFFGEQPSRLRQISFVTHHQLMQRDILHEMFGDDLAGLIGWLELGRIDLVSPISEYHSYGRFISSRHPERCYLARWNNLFIDSRDQDVESLIDFYSDEYSSISAHRY